MSTHAYTALTTASCRQHRTRCVCEGHEIDHQHDRDTYAPGTPYSQHEPHHAVRLFVMGSYSKSSKAPSTAKARSQKRHRRILHIPGPTQICHESSIFDDMTDMQRLVAYSYFYDHPDELPDRESGAVKRAKQKPAKIRVKFDEEIFERGYCTRPIPVDQLEGVDPLICSTPDSSVSDVDELCTSPSPLNRWLRPLLY